MGKQSGHSTKMIQRHFLDQQLSLHMSMSPQATAATYNAIACLY